jgi:hypothetical protein
MSLENCTLSGVFERTITGNHSGWLCTFVVSSLASKCALKTACMPARRVLHSSALLHKMLYNTSLKQMIPERYCQSGGLQTKSVASHVYHEAVMELRGDILTVQSIAGMVKLAGWC